MAITKQTKRCRLEREQKDEFRSQLFEAMVLDPYEDAACKNEDEFLLAAAAQAGNLPVDRCPVLFQEEPWGGTGRLLDLVGDRWIAIDYREGMIQAASIEWIYSDDEDVGGAA